jgi:hypothetical protein
VITQGRPDGSRRDDGTGDVCRVFPGRRSRPRSYSHSIGSIPHPKRNSAVPSSPREVEEAIGGDTFPAQSLLSPNQSEK